MFAMRRFLLASFHLGMTLGIVLAAPQPASAGPSATFEDWAVTCSDGLDCTAATVSARADAGYGIVSLALRRTAAPNAPLRLELAGGGTEGVSGDAAFTIDGGPISTIPATRFAPATEGAAYTTAAPLVRDVLLPAFLAGDVVTVSAEVGGEQEYAQFSLVGVTAALRFMDEVQNRAGTRTALVATGTEQGAHSRTLPTDIANAGDLPEPVAALWRRAPANCSDLGDFVFGPIGFSASLGDSRLYVLRCGTPGAYNMPYALYLLSGDAAQPVPLPTMSAAGPTADMMAWNVDWDEEAKTLSAFFKGRGIGDCGDITSWRWDEETGAAPVLVSAFVKEECDGALFEPVARWRLWPPRGRR